MVKVSHRSCESIQIRMTLVELLNAKSSITSKITNVTGSKSFNIVFRLSNLKILKHKLILSFGEKWGLELGDLVVGDEETTIAAAGRHSSFALSILRRFIVVVQYLNLIKYATFNNDVLNDIEKLFSSFPSHLNELRGRWVVNGCSKGALRNLTTVITLVAITIRQLIEFNSTNKLRMRKFSFHYMP